MVLVAAAKRMTNRLLQVSAYATIGLSLGIPTVSWSVVHDPLSALIRLP